MTAPTWFVTGINSGLGRAIATHVLDAGGRVAGTVRHTDSVADLQEHHGERLVVLELDLTELHRIAMVVDEAFARLGSIDVVVNNAGYGLYGTVEELTLEQVEHVVDTNLVGAIAVVRAALPHLRAQGHGRLVQMSSYAGQATRPGVCMYNATKWGIEGFMESIARDVAPLGIGVTIVEPGRARTDFHTAGRLQTGRWLAAYDDTPAAAVRAPVDAGASMGDPAVMARLVVESVGQSPAPLRLVLGSDAHAHLRDALTERLAAIEAQADTASLSDER